MPAAASYGIVSCESFPVSPCLTMAQLYGSDHRVLVYRKTFRVQGDDVAIFMGTPVQIFCVDAFIVTSRFSNRERRVFLPPSACSHAEQNISSLSGLALVRYARPELFAPAWFGIALPRLFRPGIGCPPSSPTSQLTHLDALVAPSLQ